jgi:L-aminopeptidase/D-esterase-like protein
MNRRHFTALSASTLPTSLTALTTANAQTGNSSPLIAGAITQVPGIKVGHATSPARPTGCTVIITEEGATAGVDVRGAAPGTRETDLLNPMNLVDKVHAIMLAGGSAFGLDAASGVMRWLEEKQIGFPAGPARVPIVPAAILFDLTMGDHRIRPDAAMGYQACVNASTNAPAQGSVGAGIGASVGKFYGMGRAMKGGLGTASIKVGGITVGAIVAVNAVGDVIDPRTGKVLAGVRTADGKQYLNITEAILKGDIPPALQAGMATTIGCIATDAVLTKAQAQKVAQMAHNGLARTISPVHTQWDGDTIFAVATGKSNLPGNLIAIGTMASAVMAAAVIRAVTNATRVTGAGVPELPVAGEL